MGNKLQWGDVIDASITGNSFFWLASEYLDQS